MFNTTHTAHPRCPIMCKDSDTGDVIQCARWDTHTGEHYSYQYVIRQMAQRLARRLGWDSLEEMPGTRIIVVAAHARVWYQRLVT